MNFHVMPNRGIVTARVVRLRTRPSAVCGVTSMGVAGDLRAGTFYELFNRRSQAADKPAAVTRDEFESRVTAKPTSVSPAVYTEPQ